MNFREDFRDEVAPSIVEALGEPAQIFPVGGGSPVSVQVALEEPFIVQPDVAAGGIESVAPQAQYLRIHYPEPAHGDRVEVNSQSYRVVGIEDDNEFVTLVLEREP